jgi:transposase-like protein
MGKRQKRSYTLEFKQQVADLASRVGVSRASEQLGVNLSTVHRWREKSKRKEPITALEKLSLEEENRRLKKENDELKKVNHILKRAAAFFSQDHLK